MGLTDMACHLREAQWPLAALSLHLPLTLPPHSYSNNSTMPSNTFYFALLSVCRPTHPSCLCAVHNFPCPFPHTATPSHTRLIYLAARTSHLHPIYLYFPPQHNRDSFVAWAAWLWQALGVVARLLLPQLPTSHTFALPSPQGHGCCRQLNFSCLRQAPFYSHYPFWPLPPILLPLSHDSS